MNICGAIGNKSTQSVYNSKECQELYSESIEKIFIPKKLVVNNEIIEISHISTHQTVSIIRKEIDPIDDIEKGTINLKGVCLQDGFFININKEI